MGIVLWTAVLGTQSKIAPEIALFSEREVQCLARAVYHEARGESILGQQHVAKTIVNRLTTSGFPSTICDIVYQPHQFTGIRQLRVRDTKAYLLAKDIAYEVLNGEVLLEFHGLYFHAKHVSPRWGKKRIATIGSHIFYK
jgi:spore germination cell wall hydrolase CwlJ-like protein